ncbi:restriction endonuclease [Candidatus Micrarchaeota archaeon]|nr:restriction endonuclease [Candidatus Micrarchaeota archaeon]
MTYVIKLNGKREPFQERKLAQSLRKAGADRETIDGILQKIRPTLYDGISTKQLFQYAFRELAKYRPHSASRFDLKNALLRLGKEGRVFEKFTAKLLQRKGYATQLNRIVRGKYVTHEIDVIADRKGERLMVECKHSVLPWKGTNIQTALYVYARFLDVKPQFTAPLLATNTKFSDQVIAYSKGVNLQLLGWKYPKGNSLESNIEEFKLYPITVLRSIPRNRLPSLFENGMVLVAEIAEKNPKELERLLRVRLRKADAIIQEAQALSQPSPQ